PGQIGGEHRSYEGDIGDAGTEGVGDDRRLDTTGQRRAVTTVVAQLEPARVANGGGQALGARGVVEVGDGGGAEVPGPLAISPPSVLTGRGPSISSAPSATSFSWSPSVQKPFSARWMISAPASVSWSWMTSTSSGPIPDASYAAREASTVGPGVSSIGS